MPESVPLRISLKERWTLSGPVTFFKCMDLKTLVTAYESIKILSFTLQVKFYKTTQQSLLLSDSKAYKSGSVHFPLKFHPEQTGASFLPPCLSIL